MTKSALLRIPILISPGYRQTCNYSLGKNQNAFKHERENFFFIFHKQKSPWVFMLIKFEKIVLEGSLWVEIKITC